jgi:hypothetical protein
MRLVRLQHATLTLSLLASACFLANTTCIPARAQSAVTGALSGVVSDVSGAVVPNAKVVVTDASTDAKQTVITNAEGRYTVGLLKPGLYKVTATAQSLKSDTMQITVVLGTTVPADIRVSPTGNSEVIEVTSTSLPLVDTQNVALATTFSEQQIQELPTPGGDVSTVAFTAPGVVVNAGGMYGNFSSDGLPGISNLLVLNGYDNMDPFLNLGNSGSSNLTLGQGELAEATVIQNGYNAQYGRVAGAIINYTTRSGGNRFHGEADYNYNGSVLNANGWFNQFLGAPRPHAVSNQWAANAGGPIIKDKLFFFTDYEGLHYVLPDSSGPVTFPSPQLQAYVLSNVPAVAQPFYAQSFAAYQSAPAYASAVPVTTGSAATQDASGNLGCGSNAAVPGTGGTLFYGGLAGTSTGAGGTFGVDTPCMTVGHAQANNINIEWLLTNRVDWNVSDKQKIYGRIKVDRGSQPTFTSFINPLFSAVSIQPEDEGQFNDTYILSSNKTNVFVITSSWYSAYFGPANTTASYAELPMFLIPDDGLDGSGVNGSPGLPLLGVPFDLTQGRDSTMYQFIDDFSWIEGKHTFKFGENFRRALIDDYDQRIDTIFPEGVELSLGDFAGGYVQSVNTATPSLWGALGYNNFNQAYTTAPTAHLALYNIGAYAQDEYQALPTLKLTFGVRIDRTGNPLCNGNCFSSYEGAFQSGAATLTSPFNTANGGPLNAAAAHPFPSVQTINFQPRFGFNYAFNDKTELRGGVGIFADLYPASFLDGPIQNFPNVNVETVYSGALAPSGAGSVGAFTAAGNAAIQSGFSTGQSVQQINTAETAAGIPFAPPNINAYFPGRFKVPEYAEYSMQLERQITRSDAVVLTYAGNFGYDEIVTNPYVNASSGGFNNATGGWAAVAPFAGLSTTPPDQRFSRVTSFTNDAHSNFNGALASYKHSGHGLTGQLSYTYSHALDTISNGGVGLPANTVSQLNQLTPNLGPGNLNYSNADYDVRNDLVGDAVYDEPYHSPNKLLNSVAGGWIVGFKTYYRSGEPFSITNGGVLGSFHTLGTSLMAQTLPGINRHNILNPTGSNPHSCSYVDCMDASGGATASQFVPYTSQDTFGNLRRNAIFGPHYVDSDVSLLKKLVTAEGLTLEIGANAYNLFNHVNFAPPVSDVSLGSFGQIQSAVAPPTSPYGSFQGAAVTQRLLQIHGKITF